MALYVVVHHRKDLSQPWSNAWIDDDKLKAITTTAEIGHLCENEKRKNNRVYVHRCAWGGIDHVICCSAQIHRVAKIDNNTSLVEFTDVTSFNLTPPINPIQGQNYYLF